MDPLLGHDPLAAAASLPIIIALLLGACSMVYFGLVKVKMLPFDNKSEFQIILNMPEGAPWSRPPRPPARSPPRSATEPEVTDYQIYAGTASPFNFNGLVRHYFMRRGANVADIQVNLVPKGERNAAEPRHRQARPPARRRHRREIRRARWPWPRCRPARRCCRPSSPKSTARRGRAA